MNLHLDMLQPANASKAAEEIIKIFLKDIPNNDLNTAKKFALFHVDGIIDVLKVIQFTYTPLNFIDPKIFENDLQNLKLETHFRVEFLHAVILEIINYKK